MIVGVSVGIEIKQTLSEVSLFAVFTLLLLNLSLQSILFYAHFILIWLRGLSSCGTISVWQQVAESSRPVLSGQDFIAQVQHCPVYIIIANFECVQLSPVDLLNLLTNTVQSFQDIVKCLFLWRHLYICILFTTPTTVASAERLFN